MNSSGKDSRPLVTTAQSTYSLGLTAGAFREWARRRGVTRAALQATGTPGPPSECGTSSTSPTPYAANRPPPDRQGWRPAAY
ncbi:hypothetical protein OG266_19845 [Streptomyces sp. NBC_00554]|uniref:hypothetical protein n=1 Tax=unclassified Streptomyces TaxID=2593676 RepID=UPI0032545EE7|nr:hypothetical protein OG266_19845 [Streptomyces sp. NBC_00554]